MAQKIIRDYVMQPLGFGEQHIQQGKQLFVTKQPETYFVFTDKKIVPIQSTDRSEQFVQKRLRLLRGLRSVREGCLKNLGASPERIGDRSRHFGILPKKFQDLGRFRSGLINPTVRVPRAEQTQKGRQLDLDRVQRVQPLDDRLSHASRRVRRRDGSFDKLTEFAESPAIIGKH